MKKSRLQTTSCPNDGHSVLEFCKKELYWKIVDTYHYIRSGMIFVVIEFPSIAAKKRFIKEFSDNSMVQRTNSIMVKLICPCKDIPHIELYRVKNTDNCERSEVNSFLAR